MSGERFLEGRHAVVTGGGRGIGAAVAAELARLGASVTIMGRDRERLEARAIALGEEHAVRVDTEIFDAADEDSVVAAFGSARGKLGDPYILVNNAGIAEAAPLVGMERALWDRMLAVDLTGPMLCMQQVLPAMVAARAGRIINVASTAGLRGYRTLAAYCSAKHGLVGLTRAAAMEVVRSGVTVNAVCPGYTETDMAVRAIENVVATTGKSAEEARGMLEKTNPRRTLITVDEVASAVAWLCSPHATAVTGQAIAVAAGEVM